MEGRRPPGRPRTESRMAARANQLRREHSKGNYKAGPAQGQNTHTHTSGANKIFSIVVLIQ